MLQNLSTENKESESLSRELERYRTWIAGAAEVCERAARGDLEARNLHVPPDGDLSRLLHGINHLLDMTDAFVRESRAALDYAANGKLFRRVIPRGMLGTFRMAAGLINKAIAGMISRRAENLKDADRRRQQIGQELSLVIQTLASSATESRATALTLSNVANQTVDRASTAAGAAEQASLNMSRISEASARLRQESSEVDSKTRECASLASEASQHAVEAGPVVDNLTSVSRRVSDILKLVSQIAQQTNLLALNATIEAAHAGDAGRGFAVVAAEVKDLARRTTGATEEISAEIKQMQDAASRVAGALDQISRQIQGVDRISADIAQSTERQRLSANEIAENVKQAAALTSEVSATIRSVRDASEETDSCATQLLEASDELSRQSERLNAESQRFLASTLA